MHPAGTVSFSEWSSTLDADAWKPGTLVWRRTFTNFFGPQVLRETWEFGEVRRSEPASEAWRTADPFPPGYCFLTFRGVRGTTSGRAGLPASIHAAVMSDAVPAMESASRFSMIGWIFEKNSVKYSSS